MLTKQRLLKEIYKKHFNNKSYPRGMFESIELGHKHPSITKALGKKPKHLSDLEFLLSLGGYKICKVCSKAKKKVRNQICLTCRSR